MGPGVLAAASPYRDANGNNMNKHHEEHKAA